MAAKLAVSSNASVPGTAILLNAFFIVLLPYALNLLTAAASSTGGRRCRRRISPASRSRCRSCRGASGVGIRRSIIGRRIDGHWFSLHFVTVFRIHRFRTAQRDLTGQIVFGRILGHIRVFSPKITGYLAALEVSLVGVFTRP